jgi:hypothetical protein
MVGVMVGEGHKPDRRFGVRPHRSLHLPGVRRGDQRVDHQHGVLAEDADAVHPVARQH